MIRSIAWALLLFSIWPLGIAMAVSQLNIQPFEINVEYDARLDSAFQDFESSKSQRKRVVIQASQGQKTISENTNRNIAITLTILQDEPAPYRLSVAQLQELDHEQNFEVQLQPDMSSQIFNTGEDRLLLNGGFSVDQTEIFFMGTTNPTFEMETLNLVLDISIPPDALPGTYTGELIFRLYENEPI